MNKFMKLAPIGIIVVALALMLMIGRNLIDSNLPALGSNYYKDFKSDAELEYKYSQKGPYEVSSREVKAEGELMGEIDVWYPDTTDQKKFPMIIVANPTMIKASQYKPFFSRLASWGFVVVGNDDTQSGTGAGTSMTLDAMLGLVETHPLRDLIDYDNIGVLGYSQGGSGALAAVTEYDNGDAYKAIFTGSAVSLDVGEEYGWKYDTSKITVPCFMTAGTGDTDSGNEAEDVVGAAPLVSLMDNYDQIDDGVYKVMARSVGTEHSEMLTKCDGYMTAWMLYQLSKDTDAAKVFEGGDCELLNNSGWQDVKIQQ